MLRWKRTVIKDAMAACSAHAPRQLGAVDLEGADKVHAAEEKEGERRQRVAVRCDLELKCVELPVAHCDEYALSRCTGCC